MNESHKFASSVLTYTQIQLPEKPRLAPWITPVDLGDNRLNLRSAAVSHMTLRLPLLIELFHVIQPLLDGKHTVEQILDMAGKETMPTTIIFLLKMLRAHGLLQEAERPASLNQDEVEQWDRQIQFFAHFVSDPLPVQGILLKSHIGITGKGSLVDSVRSALESLGIGRVTPVNSIASSSNGSEPDWIQELDLLVVATDSPEYGIFEKVNATRLNDGVRWMRVAIEGVTAHVGPTILPHQTACYTCYELRLRSNLADLDSFRAFRKHALQTTEQTDEGVLKPFWVAVSAQVALEVARLLTAFAPPQTISRFYELSPTSPLAVAHDVLRVPRCPSCGRRTLLHEAWDLALQPTERGTT